MNDFINKESSESIMASALEIILRREPLFALFEKGELDLGTLPLYELFLFVSYCCYELGIESVYKIIAECD